MQTCLLFLFIPAAMAAFYGAGAYIAYALGLPPMWGGVLGILVMTLIGVRLFD